MTNKYEIENIIKKTGQELFGKDFKMPFYFNDSKAGYGHTYKYHRSSAFNQIWPIVIEKLHNLKLNNWYMSHPLNTEDRDNVIQSKWVGIRSDHPTYCF